MRAAVVSDSDHAARAVGLVTALALASAACTHSTPVRSPPSASSHPAPTKTAAEAARSPGEVPIRLEAVDPGVSFGVDETGPDARSLGTCSAPCKLALDPGTYAFTASSAGRSPIAVEPAVVVRTPATLRVKIESRSGARAVGGIIILGSIIGAAAIATSFGSHEYCTTGAGDAGCRRVKEGNGIVFFGLAVGILGTLLGAKLMTTSDVATVTVVPLAPGSFGAREPRPVAAAWMPSAPSGDLVPGLTLLVRL